MKRDREQFEKDNNHLRNQVDGDDQFMTGHQIKKMRSRERKIPVWANDNVAVQNVVNSAFPKWQTNPRQRQQAARWAVIITLYFRMHMTTRQVARDLSTTPKTVENTVASIRRVARGRRADNKGPRGLRGPGRPKSEIH